MKKYATTDQREPVSPTTTGEVNLHKKSSTGVQYTRFCSVNSNEDHDAGLLTKVEVDGRYDVLKRVAWKIKTSASFLAIYFLLIIVNAAVLIWEISASKNRWLVIGLEILVNLAYLTEILIEILTQGVAIYFTKFWNCVDSFVCLMCLVLFTIFLSDDTPQDHEDIESRVDSVLIIIRYLMQMLRLYRFAIKGKNTQQISNQGDIVFEY